jgi:hypothetical protein
MNMMYHFEKIKLEYSDRDPSIEEIEKLMNRCDKLYSMIDSFVNIFKLIHKKERLETKGKMDETLNERLKIAITLLLNENPTLPSSFNFKGRSEWAHNEVIQIK